MPGFLPSLAGLSVPTGVKRVKEVSSDEDAARSRAPAPARPRGTRPESDQQRRLLKAARLNRPSRPSPLPERPSPLPERPSPSPSPEPGPARGYDREQQRGRSRTVEASDDESGTEKADSDANSDTEADDEADTEADDDAGVDGDAPMAVVIAPPSAAGPAGRLADLQQRKRDIETSLVTLEQLQEAEQAAATAKMNVATNEDKQKAANLQDRSMSKRGDEGVAQEQAVDAHKRAKNKLALANKRLKTAKADNAEEETLVRLKQEIHDLKDAQATAESARVAAEKEFQKAKAAVLQRINELGEKASGLARTMLETADALAQLKQKRAEDEKALKEINRAIKSASLDEKKEDAAAQKEAKAAEREAAKQANAAAKQAEKEAAKQAEEKAKEKAEKCEELACEIHRFRHRVAEDLRAEAKDITDDLKKNDWCERPDGEEGLTIPKEDAAWFKELVRFVKDTEKRLQLLIANNQNMDGETLDWHSERHERMLKDFCPEGGGEEDESNGLGKLVGSDSEELEGAPDEGFIVPDDHEGGSGLTNEDRKYLQHVQSGEHKRRMFKKFEHYGGKGDDPSALAEKAEQTRTDELKAPAGPAQIDILGRDEPAADGAASTAEKKKKKRITPERTDGDRPGGGD